MNPTRHQSLTEFRGAELRIDPPLESADENERSGGSDFTEDLANEITAELDPAPRWINARASRAIEPVQLSAEQAPAANDPIVSTGSVLRDRYVLEQKLGNGGTAMIFRAIDLRRDAAAADGQHVAIKLLRPELRGRAPSIARLQREFRQTQGLSHPNIVRFHDLDCDHGSWFIVMELLVGEALGPSLRRASPNGLPNSEAIHIATAVGDALAFAHGHGVIHGDVKPDNIFLAASGEVRLLDFGVAPESSLHPSSADPALAVPVAAAATKVYASPEVLAGEDPDPRDDVFSLSCVIYEMLTGRHPYGRRCADAAKDARLEVDAPDNLSAMQWAALAAGLAWDRGERPPLRQLIDCLGDETRALPEPPALANVEAPRATPEQPAVPVPMIARAISRRSIFSWRGALVSVLALAAGLMIGHFATDSQAPPLATQTASPPAAGAAPAVASPVKAPADDFVQGDAGIKTPVMAALPVEVAESGPTVLPSLVTFDTASMIVSGRAIVAAIPVRHLTPIRRDVEVGWRIIDGSAIAGRDYAGSEAGIAKFSEGHTFRIIYVPIITKTRATSDRTFTVELSGASTGASLGTARILVTILGDA